MWLSVHVTPGHVCELLWICVDLSQVRVSKSCLLKKTLSKFSWKDYTKILQNDVCLERLCQNWQSGHVTPGHMCELLLISVDLSQVGVSKSCLLKKTLPKFSWKDFTKILQNDVCLEGLYQNWQSGHVTPGHVCELLLICVDLSQVGVSKSCLLNKTLPKFS